MFLIKFILVFVKKKKYWEKKGAYCFELVLSWCETKIPLLEKLKEKKRSFLKSEVYGFLYKIKSILLI